jgi:hypothetical protein
LKALSSTPLSNSRGTKTRSDYIASGVTAESTFKFTWPAQSKTGEKPSYEGGANVVCEKISGLPQVNTIDSVQAKLAFANDTITLKEAHASVLNTPVSAMGKFEKGALEAVANGTFDLADLTRFIPDGIELPGYKISGAADITARVSRAATAEATPIVTLEAQLKDIWLKIMDDNIVLATDLADVTVDLNNQTLVWELASVIVNEETYGCSGTLTNFKTPAITARLNGPFYSIAADGVVQGQRIVFNSLEARTKLSQLDVSGAYDTAARTFNVQGQLLLNALDLPRLAPKFQETWKRAGAAGQLLVQLELSGPLDECRAWKARANASSRALSFYGYRAENISLDYQQAERQGFLNNLTFNAYKGSGLIKGRITLGEKISWALRGAIDGLDLNALKVDTPMKDKTLSGTTALEMSVQGIGADPATTTGGGKITIKDGNIWEFNPLKGLGNFLFIPKFSNLIFTSAAGDIYVKDSKIGSDNMELTGSELGLLVQGAMTFSGDLNFVVMTQLPLPAGKSTPIGETIQAITRTGSMTAIEVTGTTKEPKYKLRAIGGNIAQKISDVVSSILP